MMLRARLIVGLLLLLPAVLASAATVENIRIWSDEGRTRVVLDLSTPADHKIFTLRGPDRIVVDLTQSKLANGLANLPSGNGAVNEIRSGLRADGGLRVVLDLKE